MLHGSDGVMKKAPVIWKSDLSHCKTQELDKISQAKSGIDHAS